MVGINELIRAVNIVLGLLPVIDCSALDINGGGMGSINEVIGAVGHALNGCPPLIGALGTRHFSIDPETSLNVAVITNIPFPQNGFTGFLELTAGEPDPITGAAFVDITDASEFISIDILIPGGPTICVRPVRDLFPIENAGGVFCNGGVAAGFFLNQDHNIGVVDTCTAPGNGNLGAGLPEGMPCASDDECASGQCFTEADCLAASSGDPTEIPPRVEGPDDAHSGVCNGPSVAGPLPGDSGPGAVFIGMDPVTGLTQGLPVEILTEEDLPCGDEPDAPGAGTILPLALTTATAASQVLDFNNLEGEILAGEPMGENFVCERWSEEDSPGLFCLGRLTSLAVCREAV